MRWEEIRLDRYIRDEEESGGILDWLNNWDKEDFVIGRVSEYWSTMVGKFISCIEWTVIVIRIEEWSKFIVNRIYLIWRPIGHGIVIKELGRALSKLSRTLRKVLKYSKAKLILKTNSF